MVSSLATGFAPLADLKGQTVGSVLDHGAEQHPNRVFAVFPETQTKVTWEGQREAVARLQPHLANLGISEGEVVGVLMANGRTALELFLGCMSGRRVSLMLNSVAGIDTLGYVIKHSGIRHLFTDDEHASLASAAVAASAQPVKVHQVASDSGLQLPAIQSDQITDPPGSADDALLIYTSGTTGRPKGVVHTHASLLAGGANTCSAHHLSSTDRALCVLPLCHINGQVVTVMAPLVSGSSVVMPRKFSTQRFWYWVSKEDCTWFSVVPTMISYLLGMEEDAQHITESQLSHVRFGRSASAPLAPAVHKAFVARFGIPMVETMGITETAAQILSNPLDPAQQKIGSPGLPCGNEIRIRDGEGVDCKNGVVGEIEVHGPNLMRTYINDELATREAFSADGWYRTGDLGYKDISGYVYVTGRIKEIIIKGGENISPREIDDVLYRYPGVLEAAAIAVPDPEYGEDIAACVVPNPGQQLDKNALRDFCIKTLGPFKSPKHIYVLDELPKGPSGKIQRLKLSGEYSS